MKADSGCGGKLHDSPGAVVSNKDRKYRLCRGREQKHLFLNRHSDYAVQTASGEPVRLRMSALATLPPSVVSRLKPALIDVLLPGLVIFVSPVCQHAATGKPLTKVFHAKRRLHVLRDCGGNVVEVEHVVTKSMILRAAKSSASTPSSRLVR